VNRIWSVCPWSQCVSYYSFYICCVFVYISFYCRLRDYEEHISVLKKEKEHALSRYIYIYLSNKIFSLQKVFTSSVISSHSDCKMKKSDSNTHSCCPYLNNTDIYTQFPISSNLCNCIFILQTNTTLLHAKPT
jgi:hypothetical protein